MIRDRRFNCSNFATFVYTLWNIHLATKSLSLIIKKDSTPGFGSCAAAWETINVQETFSRFLHSPVIKILIVVSSSNKIASSTIICNGFCSFSHQKKSQIQTNLLNLTNKTFLLNSHKTNFRIGQNKAIGLELSLRQAQKR